MKLTLAKILFIGIIVQILSTQGILTFNIFKLFGFWELKKAVHPVGVSLILLYFFLKFGINQSKFKLSHAEVFLFFYFSIQLVFQFFSFNNIESIYLSIRDSILIFILIFIYSKIDLPQRYYDKILSLLLFLVLANIGFIVLTFIFGPEDYMKLMTGRYVWANDPIYKFKITNLNIFWRSPGLIGESASVGMFGVLALVLFNEHPQFKSKRIFPLVLAILSFTRSVYLIMGAYTILKYILTKRNIRKFKYVVPYMLIIGLILAIYLSQFDLFSFKSIKMRIDHWQNDLNISFNYLFGGNLGNVGSAVRNEGFISVLDSYWLLTLLTFGILGISLVIAFFFEKFLQQEKNKLVLLAFAAGGFFITLTQSIPFLVLFPLLFLQNRLKVFNRIKDGS